MAEAKLNREYALRVMGVGVLMLGMCCWSIFDGMVFWPRINQRMEQVRPELLATALTAEAWLARGETEESPLDKIFKQKGYQTPTKLIKKLSELVIPVTAQNRNVLLAAQPTQVTALFSQSIYDEHDLQTQFVQAAVTFILGVWILGALSLKARKRYLADEHGLSGSGFGRQGLAYEEIASIDWRKWNEKGIVVVTRRDGRRHKLDAWHFAGLREVVAQIQQQRPELCTQGDERLFSV